MDEAPQRQNLVLGTKKIVNILSTTSAFMFKGKSCMIKKILKFSKLPKDESIEVKELKRKIHRLLKTFTENELDVLLKTLQANGGIDSDCILVNSSDFRHTSRLSSSTFKPRILLAKVFRFPNMKDEYLRFLSCCYNHSSCDDRKICINPFHSSLVIDSEPPLPPYIESMEPPGQTQHQSYPHTDVRVPPPTQEIVNTEEVSSGSCVSSCSSDSSVSDTERPWYTPWCRIRYWEEKYPVGHPFHVTEDCINVFENLPQGSGLDLSMLSNTSVPQTEASSKVKENIGNGFQLTREPDGIWLYNRSDIVLFAGSPTIQLESVNVTQPVVKRLPPGTSVLVYDPNLVPDSMDKYTQLYNSRDSSKSSSGESSNPAHLRSIQPFCVRVSFEKGWGKNYTRMLITQCPCWVEIYLTV